MLKYASPNAPIVILRYAGTGGHRVVFRREIAPTSSTRMPEDLADRVAPSRDDLDQVLAS